MKSRTLFALAGALFVFSTTQTQAQENTLVRPRVVGQTATKPQLPAPSVESQKLRGAPALTPQTTAPATMTPQTKVPVPAAPLSAAPTTAAPSAATPVNTAPLTFLTPSMIQTRIGEARRMLKTRPMATALGVPAIDLVTVAAFERETARTHLITISKQSFLTKGADINALSSLGTNLNIKVLRANGVNTALTIFTPTGQSLVPLTVEFPIEKNGSFREMAYYTSAHPALLSGDLVRSGQSYVRNMLDLAASRLRDRGVTISPQIVDVAERLCVVQHVDHDRFRAENRLALYEEIYSQFALNELDN